MDAIRLGTFLMADPDIPAPEDRPPTPPGVPSKVTVEASPDEHPGRYVANVQLILRRLADHDRTLPPRPKRWWQGR